MPENLPTTESIKKVEQTLKRDEKKALDKSATNVQHKNI
jgi:hypothetical protein